MTPVLAGSTFIFLSSGHMLFLGAPHKTRRAVFLARVCQGLLASISSVSYLLANFTHH